MQDVGGRSKAYWCLQVFFCIHMLYNFFLKQLVFWYHKLLIHRPQFLEFLITRPTFFNRVFEKSVIPIDREVFLTEILSEGG